jgi:hypothetical protein
MVSECAPTLGEGVNPGLRAQRLRLTWLLAIPFLVLARPTPAYLIAGVLLSVPGLLLRGSAAGHIDKDRVLAVSGPFSHLRHPLYVGSFFLGIGLMVGGGRWFLPPLFVGIFCWLYARTIRAEEEALLARFGLAFAEYQSVVPALVPRIRPVIPHQWRASTEPKTRAGDPGTNGIGRSLIGASTEGGFQLRRFLQNREWEAWLGMLLGFGLLAVKMIWAP